MEDKPIPPRRYLPRIDSDLMGQLYTDTVIIGGGIAGLRAAIAAAETGRVIILVKDKVNRSNTWLAQGGIAAVIEETDTFESHIEDTLRTGCGLSDPDVVNEVVRAAPDHIRQLQNWTAPFDTLNGRLATGREGGHSQSRIIHAYGDATGRALAECLLNQVLNHKNIKIFEDCFCIDLLTAEKDCVGVCCWHPKHRMQCIWSRQTILASGGAGQLWRESTNPSGATADGLAMAWRAGATLANLEFMQFHPTTLYIAGADRSLITEALRGEGARLVDTHGHRFMSDFHEQGELAPRDVVSRAIYHQMHHTESTHVYLDVRHLGSKLMQERFPTISALCQSFDIDVDHDLIPVRPSAHYMIGGVKVDRLGQTSIPNLYCCGEAASTGLHGANRLASNSLLEGLVYGKIVGQQVARILQSNPGRAERYSIVFEVPESPRTRLDIVDVYNSLRAVMWRNVGLVRIGERLDETLEIIDFWRRYVMDKVFDEPASWQCQNMLTISRLITSAALTRRESRGVHFRKDFPDNDDARFKYSIEMQLPQ